MKLLVIISIFITSLGWAGVDVNDPTEGVKIGNNTDEGISIYPMPVKGDAFRISGINTLAIKSIEVFDICGRLVGEIDKSQIDDNGAVSVDHFNEGTYILSIIFDDRKVSKKIIIG